MTTAQILLGTLACIGGFMLYMIGRIELRRRFRKEVVEA